MSVNGIAVSSQKNWCQFRVMWNFFSDIDSTYFYTQFLQCEGFTNRTYILYPQKSLTHYVTGSLAKISDLSSGPFFRQNSPVMENNDKISTIILVG